MFFKGEESFLRLRLLGEVSFKITEFFSPSPRLNHTIVLRLQWSESFRSIKSFNKVEPFSENEYVSGAESSVEWSPSAVGII